MAAPRKDGVELHRVRQAEIDGGLRPGTTSDDATSADQGVHGAKKIHAELGREAAEVARRTVERPARAEGLRGTGREKACPTTIGARTPGHLRRRGPR